MTTTPAMPEPFAWAWRNKVTGAKGVYFEDPKPFGITSHPDYEWTNLYTEAQALAILALRPQPESDARAALSEAKAGGWQDISTAPEGTMILCANMNAREAREWCFVAWMAGGKVCGHRMDKPTHWQPLPAPPAQRGEG